MRIVLFAIVLFALTQSCTEEKIQPQLDKSIKQSEIPSHESWKSKIMFTEEGKVKAVLYTDHLRKFENRKITLLETVTIDFYDKDQKKTSKLSSDSGKVDDITKDMYAYKNVVAKNDSGVVLRTSELMWRNNDQKIITDKFVSITSPKEIIEGYGLESDQSLKNYVIFNVTYSSTPGKKK